MFDDQVQSIFLRPLQFQLAKVPHSNRVPLTPEMKLALLWWVDASHLTGGTPIHALESTVNTFTDASTVVWGGHVAEQKFAGTWTLKERKLHINEQSGGNKVVVSVAGDQGQVPLVRQRKVDNCSQTHSRSPKCTGRQAVQTGTDSANGMQPPSGGGQPAVHNMGNRDNKRCPTFVSPYTDPQALGTDALSISWEGISGYTYPPQSGNPD